MQESEVALRKMAIHMLRRGSSPVEVAQELKRSLAWVYKWRERFFKHQDWKALEDQSPIPKHPPRKFSESVRQAIRATRSELEAEAKEPGTQIGRNRPNSGSQRTLARLGTRQFEVVIIGT